jgi:hypothetical protein
VFALAGGLQRFSNSQSLQQPNFLDHGPVVPLVERAEISQAGFAHQLRHSQFFAQLAENDFDRKRSTVHKNPLVNGEAW